MSGLVQRVFAAREILIRSEGRVRYLTLTPRLQVALAGAMVGAVGWVAFSSVGVILEDHRLVALDAERDQAKTAYIGMLNELADYYDQFARLADGLGEKQSDVLGLFGDAAGRQESNPLRKLIQSDPTAPSVDGTLAYEAGLRRLLDLSGQTNADPAEFKNKLKTSEQALTGNLAELKERLRLSEDEADRVVEMRRRIAGQLEDVQGRLDNASNQHGSLAMTLVSLRERLADAERSEGTFIANQARLNDQIASLGRQLDTTRDVRANLEQRAETLSQQLDAVGGDKSQLEQQVAQLTVELEAVRGDKKTLEQEGEAAQQALAAVIGQRNALHAARTELNGRVGELEERLTVIESAQDDFVQSIVERTRDGVNLIEKTVAMTGLEVDKLLGRAADELPGRGGPFVPAALAAEGGLSQLMLASVASLDDEVERWERLQFVLRSLPLTAPIDHYSISSLFGKRKDPFNGRLGVHEGLDLSAAAGTPILSTAPGKVVFAGWRGNYGRTVTIDHGLGIRTVYGHMKAISVKAGQVVDYRQKIGLLGSSGRSTGPHIHFEILVDGVPRDPMPFLKAGRYVFKG